MSVARITTVEGALALLLPSEAIKRLGVKAGDEVNVSIENNGVMVSELSGDARAERMRAITQDVLRERREAYLILAQGEEGQE